MSTPVSQRKRPHNPSSQVACKKIRGTRDVALGVSTNGSSINTRDLFENKHVDVPVRIQLDTHEFALAIFVHRSMLRKLSSWFEEKAAQSHVITLEDVST
jgi:hypothetical protein